jgi:hypothetical protein
MTIFDSIKYPIGHPPTAEQLEALPPRLFHKWTSRQWNYDARQVTPDMIANWASVRKDVQQTYEALALLRRIILEDDVQENP